MTCNTFGGGTFAGPLPSAIIIITIIIVVIIIVKQWFRVWGVEGSCWPPQVATTHHGQTTSAGGRTFHHHHSCNHCLHYHSWHCFHYRCHLCLYYNFLQLQSTLKNFQGSSLMDFPFSFNVLEIFNIVQYCIRPRKDNST